MTQMKTSSYEMKVAIIANGKPQSRRVASKLFNAFRDDPDFYLTKKNPDVVISIGGDNKSLGGAVLHPTIEALQLTEIASLNNRVYRTLGSPLIVPKHEKITVYPTRMGSYTLSVDNKTYTNRNVKKIEFSIDQRKISFVASASHTSFWERVRESFIGDMEE